MKKGDVFVFKPSEWFTPNTYDRNYMEPPDASGVYLLVAVDITKPPPSYPDYEILYVGSSRLLSQRLCGHTVLGMLRVVYNFVALYFIETENYREIEKKLIKQIQPKFNKQWR